MDKNRKVGLALLTAFVVVLSFLGYQVWCAYTIWSNTVNVTVSSYPTLTLTTNGTSLMVGDTVQLTAQLQNGVGSAKTITFYENNASIGNAVTDSLGQAVLNRQLNTAGSYNYNCSYSVP